MKRKFLDLLKNTSDHTRVCVGIDPRISLIPDRYKSSGTAISDGNTDAEILEEFCMDVIDATSGSAAAFKFNLAFFEALKNGEQALMNILKQARIHPHIALIGDSKNADIGNTNESYYQKMFEKYGFDAMTTNPYMGEPENIRELIIKEDKFLIPVLFTSNPDAEKIQKLILSDGRFLFEEVGRQIAEDWETKNNCGVVIGATKTEEDFVKACRVTRQNFVLVPGAGKQGGSLEMCVQNLHNRLFLVNSSREIIYSNRPEVAAEKLRIEINTLLRRINENESE